MSLGELARGKCYKTIGKLSYIEMDLGPLSCNALQGISREHINKKTPKHAKAQSIMNQASDQGQ